MADATAQDLVDALSDLGRVVTRQGQAIDRLVDDARASAARDRAGADIPLLVDLLALHRDATACAATARSRREREAFTVIASGLERTIQGRGGLLVWPAAGDDFDALSMEAAEVVPTSEDGQDRTIARVLDAGLMLADPRRSVRPARVAVHRLSAS